jgi:hypothetical protein
MAAVFDLSEAHPLRIAHKKSSNHRVDIERSQLCGCFHCKQTFGPDRIREWIDDGSTALCPKCEIDSVIGDGSGLQITKDFLEAMHVAWFSK